MIGEFPTEADLPEWFLPDHMTQGFYCPWPRDYVPGAEVDEKLAGFGLNKTAERDIWLGLPVYEGRVHARYCVLNARLMFVEGEAAVVWRLRSAGGFNTVIAQNIEPLATVVEAVVDGETSVQRERSVGANKNPTRHYQRRR